jgi:hypothetical protein
MTQQNRNRWSTFAMGASLFCSVLLLISAIAAAHHRNTTTDAQQPYTVSQP